MARLRECVDCGKALSPTAKTCSQCSSTDPFGGKRFDDKMKLGGIAILGVVLALAYFGVINLPAIIKSLIPH